MNFRFRFLFLFLFSPLLCLTGLSAESEVVRDKNVEAQLLSTHSTIAPGQPFTLGLKFSIDPTWHTYWSNPGETGKPTTLEVALPDGFSAGPLQFPVPKRFVVDYSIPGVPIFEAGFGYEESVIHVMTVTPPADLKVGEPVTITGNSTWLMCDPNTCVPGKADFSITLDVGAEAVRSPHAPMIDLYSSKVPARTDWKTSATLADGKVTVSIGMPADAVPADAPLHFFPDKVYIFDQLSEPEITKAEGTVSFVFDKHEDLQAAPDPITGILIAETATGKKGFRVSSGDVEEAPKPASKADAAKAVTDSEAMAPESPFGGGLIGFLFAAFIGGIILNIMPCVFPVISLKVMSFVGQAGEDRKKVFAHSLVFTLGILVFFWILATAMLILKGLGQEASWGFQMQYPGYVIGLIFIMTVVALSLFGVFEMGTSLTGVGGNLVTKDGYAGSFWSGALAVLLATPCTAPLMAPAITFAIAQSGPVLVAIFSAIGLGMAAPYFLLAIFPKLLDMIPPPGGWMETFKQFMGFPMLAVVIWLIGVLSKQLDVAGLQWALVAMLTVSIAAWVLGRYCGPERSTTDRTKGRITALIIFALSIFVAFEASKKRAPFSSTDLTAIIENHRAEGKHVFVDFTAEWCLTCKVNERTTIKTDKIQTAFKENNIEFVIADWTNEDPSITKVLKEYGRSGVPFYLLYPADQSKKAISLGDGVITPSAVMEAIDQVVK